MRGLAGFLAGLLLLLCCHDQADAEVHMRIGARRELDRVNARLCGQVVDHTFNHGIDRRIWSEALQCWRDMYVYLPPEFDPKQSYPVILYLHGLAQDEQFTLRNLAEGFDQAIISGCIPPLIVASPDGSICGYPAYRNSASFFLNSPKAGKFEDYLLKDVWNYLMEHYPIRKEREAHVIAGVSMGGTAAYRIAIEHQPMFKIVIGIFPGLNLRWCHTIWGYRGNFNPHRWGWRTSYRPNEIIARFGIVPVPFKLLSDPLFYRDDVIDGLARSNPYELMEMYDLKDGQLSMYVAYGGRDQFNIDAQVDSFLYRAHERGVSIKVGYDPKGKHDAETAMQFFPEVMAWLKPQLDPYSPALQKTHAAPWKAPHPVLQQIRKLLGR